MMGEAWLRTFDMHVERGGSAREVAEAMAKDMDRLFDAVVKKTSLETTSTIYLLTRCPHCGKNIP